MGPSRLNPLMVRRLHSCVLRSGQARFNTDGSNSIGLQLAERFTSLFRHGQPARYVRERFAAVTAGADRVPTAGAC